MKYRAVTVISGEEADKYIEEGGEEMPMQWIEVRKNVKNRTTSNPHVVPLMRSWLVARGYMELGYGRSDSPTADNESVAIVCSFAASRRLKLMSGDLESSYCQCEELTRVLILNHLHREGQKFLYKSTSCETICICTRHAVYEELVVRWS